MKRLLGVLAVMTVLGSSLAQAGADERPALRIAVQSNPSSLDPASEFSNVAWRLTNNVFDTLIVADPSNGSVLKPGLATSWRRIDDRTIELTLRDGVRFQDGSPLTVDDVVFTFGPERMSSEKAPVWGATRQYLGGIESVTASGPNTVRATTREPDLLIERRLSTLAAAIISKKAYLAAANFDTWSRSPIGTGPYKVEDIKRNDYVELEAFDGYWGGKPTARSIRFQIVPEASSRVAALKAGDVDIATDLSVDQKAEIESSGTLDFVGGSIDNIRVLVFDTTNPVLKDVKIRQAIGLAIDRDAIVQGLWQGLVRVPNGHQSPSFGDLYVKDWPVPRYDPEKAKALLAEAGYAGEPIEYRSYSDYYTNETATAQALVEMWRAVGLNVNLVIKENTQQVYEPKGRGIRNWSNSFVYPDPVGGLWRLYGARGPVQTISHEWSNDEFNRLGKVLETSLDQSERRAAWQRMMKIYDQDDPPGVILHFNGQFYGKKKSVNWQPYPVEYMELRGANLSFH